MHRLSVLVRGAFNGFVPQIVSDKAPNMFHFIEVFELFLVFLCFSCQIARGRQPTLTQTLTLTPLFFFPHFYFSPSGQAVVTGVVPSPPRFFPSIFIAHRVQQSHCSSIFHRVLLTHTRARSASQFVHKKKPPRIYTSRMHSGGFDLTKLTYTRLEDNLIRHRGDRHRPRPGLRPERGLRRAFSKKN